MNELLNINTISLNEKLTNQQEVFKKIAEIAVINNLTFSKQSVIDGLFTRESQGTTGFMDGFAIPHAKSSAIEKPGMVILTLSEGIEWKAMDDQPVRFVISLLIPKNESGTTHLSLLSSLSRMLMHSENREYLLQASTQEEILQVLNQAIMTS